MSSYGIEHRKTLGAPVGRERELALIEEFLTRTRIDGDAMFVVGDPGTGKTLLLDYAAQRASASGIRVLAAQGVEFEAEMSFSGLNQALLPLSSEFTSLSAAQGEALSVALGLSEGAAPAGLVLSNAVLAALRLAAAKQPVLLVVDDLPWVDRASTVVLGFVARRLSGTRVGFLAAARANQESFFNRSGIGELELLPLDSNGAAELVDARFPALPTSVRARILDEARGNPLALLELPASLSDDQRSARRPLPSPLPQSRRLQALFASRLESLPRATRLLLLLMALDGTGEPRVAEAVGSSGPGIGDLGPAEHAQVAFVDRETRKLTFRHPLMRAAVVELSTAEERRWAHQELAKRWVDNPELQAWHLAEAAVGQDKRAAEQLEWLAQRKLSRGDVVGAVAALTRSAELSPEAVDRARRLAEAAFIGADMSGALEDASRLLAAARDADPKSGGSLQAAITAALILLGGAGDIDAAHSLLVGAIHSWVEAGGGSDSLLAEALFTLIMVCHFGGRAELFEPFGDFFSYFQADVPRLLSVSLKTLGDPVRTAASAIPDLEQSIHDLADDPTPSGVIRTGIAAVYADRVAVCREPMRNMLRARREVGDYSATIPVLHLLGLDAWLAGRWDESAEYMDDAYTLCALHGNGLHAWSGCYVQALLAAATGEFGTARAIADATTQWAVPRGDRLPERFAWHVRSLAALGEGDYEEAFRAANTISPAGTLASHVPVALTVSMDLVEAAVRAGRHADAISHVAALREANVSAISSRQALLVGACEAMVAPDDEVPTSFRRALGLPQADLVPFEFARAQLFYGERLRRLRSVTEARLQLASALDIFKRLGAKPWASRAISELRATGQTRQRSRESAWASLTPQERQVASLAASGLTNKEIGDRLFLSHRTVAGHLYRVFPVLGIATRAALRDALADLPGPEHSER